MLLALGTTTKVPNGREVYGAKGTDLGQGLQGGAHALLELGIVRIGRQPGLVSLHRLLVILHHVLQVRLAAVPVASQHRLLHISFDKWPICTASQTRSEAHGVLGIPGHQTVSFYFEDLHLEDGRCVGKAVREKMKSVKML